jgi:hypothetical protein
LNRSGVISGLDVELEVFANDGLDIGLKYIRTAGRIMIELAINKLSMIIKASIVGDIGSCFVILEELRGFFEVAYWSVDDEVPTKTLQQTLSSQPH